nr:transposase [Gelidibacter sp. F63206]
MAINGRYVVINFMIWLFGIFLIKIKSLSSLIRAFKTTSLRMIRLSGFEDFAWKRSIYDHIIRQQKSYKNISNYIDAYPEKWHQNSSYSNV